MTLNDTNISNMYVLDFAGGGAVHLLGQCGDGIEQIWWSVFLHGRWSVRTHAIACA